MKYTVSHGKSFEINIIVLDLNGTLSVHGKIPWGVKGRLDKLKRAGFKIILFTGDQRGTADVLCRKLSIEYKVTQTEKDKEREMVKLNKNKCAAIGNARIDLGTLKHAKLSIVPLQAEGIHPRVLAHADILVPSILDALDLFLHPDSLCATLRE